MFRLHLFGKLAATLKLATVVKEAADMTLPYPTPVQATGRRFQLDEAKLEKLFTQFVNKSLREQLTQDYAEAIPQGFLLHLVEKNPEIMLGSKVPGIAKKLKNYMEVTLPNFLFGIGWPNALTAKGDDPRVQKRIETEIKNMNALLTNDVSAKRVKEFTQEFDPQEKRWVDKKTDIADRVRNTRSDIVSLYIQKNPDKANDILQKEGDWSSSDTQQLAADLADEALAKIKPATFGKQFINTFMRSVKSKVGDASYFVERDATEQGPQDIMDSLFSEILGDVQAESRRSIGIKKMDAHRWSGPSLPRYDLEGTYSVTTNMIKTVQSRVFNRTEEFLEAGKRKSKEPVEKSNLSKKIKDLEFANKEFNRVHKLVEDQVSWGKDLDKLLNLLKHLGQAGGSKQDSKRARKALATIQSVLASMRINVGQEELAATSDRLSDLEEKLKDAMREGTRSHTQFDFDTAEALVRKIDEAGDFNGASAREALINAFKNGENARAIAQAYAVSANFSTDFFRNEIPRMIKRTVEIKPKELADGSEGRLTPELRPGKPEAIKETFSADSKKKKLELEKQSSVDSEPRLRVGSLWIQKLYRDYLKGQ